MLETSYPNYAPTLGYMTEKTQQRYITTSIENKTLPAQAYRMAEIVSLSASNNLSKPIQFWQLYSVLGQNSIVKIVRTFYNKVYQDETWFSSIFARIGDVTHHVNTQSSMWLDVMGGGLKYHGAEFRLHFHHQHNAFELMNEKGAERWMKLMVEALDESEEYMTNDPRVRISINTFLCHFMEKYAADFGFQTHTLFGPTNPAIKRKLNFLNMTDTAIEALSEDELREGLQGRKGVTISAHTDINELIQKAKSL
jgi:truncated hemoglobin YjbI